MDFDQTEEFLGTLGQKFEALKAAKDTRVFNLESVIRRIQERVIGQDRLAAHIAKMVVRRAARKRSRTPMTKLFLSGPPGTGKTELGETLASAIYEKPEALLTIPCGNYAGNADLSGLIGIPDHYKGANKGHLVKFIEEFPDGGVILFDEFEKAGKSSDTAFVKLLLQLLGKGNVKSDYDGRFYDATKFVVVLTSNLEQKRLADAALETEDQEELEARSRKILADYYSPEFWDRFDIISTVTPLNDMDKARIVALDLKKIAHEHDAQIVKLGAGAYDLLFEGVEVWERSSARSVRRWLEDTIEQDIADVVNDCGTKKITLDYDAETRDVIVEDATNTNLPDLNVRDLDEGEVA
ncbi:AAA family ATPase [Roseibium aggregatum]|uniref:ATP-dependent Clp protease ATP-binding subunit ClpC n=1 Tax=Roseibium aggregatum TaxID=187304 RepID=A0A0M6YCT3_9HYPH|nr:AAA family ATPase [Roseibium aggregatum]CTQ47313.1 ATP-dependent Clp protease ATP-binding subunit ClpC [Roseibium aggregatum]